MDASEYIKQVENITQKLMNAIPFIIENKLWKGFFKHPIVMFTSLLAAIIIPWSVFDVLQSNLSALSSSMETKHATAAITENIGFESLFSGANQYLLMILIHMLNVYFSNMTIERLSGVKIDLSVKELLLSQIRNIKVVVRNWFFELIVGIGISFIIGIFGPDWLVDVFKFVVGSYFLGYIFIDNYNNTFGVPITQSFQIVKHHIGAAIVLGLVTKILLLLPFIGAVLSSFICGVAATWYMHTSKDRHAGIEAFSN